MSKLMSPFNRKIYNKKLPKYIIRGENYYFLSIMYDGYEERWCIQYESHNTTEVLENCACYGKTFKQTKEFVIDCLIQLGFNFKEKYE